MLCSELMSYVFIPSGSNIESSVFIIVFDEDYKRF